MSFQCTICDMSFDNLHNYANHVKKWKLESHAQCFHCGDDVEDLKTHNFLCDLPRNPNLFFTNALLAHVRRYQVEEQQIRIQKQIVQREMMKKSSCFPHPAVTKVSDQQ